MIEAPVVKLDFFQKLMLVLLLAFGGVIMLKIHKIIDWLRGIDNS